MGKAGKIIIIIISSVVGFYILFYAMLLSSLTLANESGDESKYDSYIAKVRGSEHQIPEISELGEYEDIKVGYKCTFYLLGTVNAISVTVKYSDQAFSEEIERINREYEFLLEKTEYMEDISASVNSYDIRVVDKEQILDEDYVYYYPKYFLMIGINEEDNSIVYLYNDDFDLDRIRDLDQYVKKHYRFG